MGVGWGQRRKAPASASRQVRTMGFCVITGVECFKTDATARCEMSGGMYHRDWSSPRACLQTASRFTLRRMDTSDSCDGQ